MSQKRSKGEATPGAPDAPVSLIGMGLTLLAAAGVVAVFVALTQIDGPGEGAEEGKAAPSFDLPSTTGERVSLDNYRGKSNVLLYFYEHPG